MNDLLLKKKNAAANAERMGLTSCDTPEKKPYIALDGPLLSGSSGFLQKTKWRVIKWT
jgi:hypothetical protein